jgi:hypothetical protein
VAERVADLEVLHEMVSYLELEAEDRKEEEERLERERKAKAARL